MRLPLIAGAASKPLSPFRGSAGRPLTVAPPVVEVEDDPEAEWEWECDSDGHDWVSTGNVHGDVKCTHCGTEDEHWTLAAATSEDDRY